jgi:RNA polymerase sigma-70 factor (ECF subfamily)
MWDETACVARACAGDEQAAREVVAFLHPIVSRIVRAKRRWRSSAEDLIQAVFARVFAKLHQYSGQAPLPHWVSRIAVNTCLTQISREIARPELRLADLSEEAEQELHSRLTDSAADAADQSGTRELVEMLLAQLKPSERLVLRLLHQEERSVDEIHRLTGWTVPVVKVRAFRARQRARQILAELLAPQRRAA